MTSQSLNYVFSVDSGGPPQGRNPQRVGSSALPTCWGLSYKPDASPGMPWHFECPAHWSVQPVTDTSRLGCPVSLLERCSVSV